MFIYLSIQRRENDDMAFCQPHPPIGLQIHHTTGNSILPSECFIYTSVQHTSRALSDILSSDVIIFIDVCQLVLTLGSENHQYFLGMLVQNAYKFLGTQGLNNSVVHHPRVQYAQIEAQKSYHLFQRQAFVNVFPVAQTYSKSSSSYQS